MPRDYRATHERYWEHSNPEPPEASTPQTACPGKCNAAYRAAEDRKALKGTEHDFEPRDGQPVWCPPCTTGIRGALCDIPELVVRLQLEIDSGVSAGALDDDLNVTGSRERALHAHQAAVFALEEIAGWLADWEDTVRDQRGLPLRADHASSPHIIATTSARFLLPHLAWLLTEHPEREASEGFGIELLAMHRKIRHLTKTQDVEPERCFGVACPYCDRNALEHEVDVLGMATGYIKCRRCRPILRMNREEYDRWTRMLAADARTRGLAPHAKLVEIFGGSIPPQFAKAAR